MKWHCGQDLHILLVHTYDEISFLKRSESQATPYMWTLDRESSEENVGEPARNTAKEAPEEHTAHTVGGRKRKVYLLPDERHQLLIGGKLA